MTNADEKRRRKALLLDATSLARHADQQRLRAERTRIEHLRKVLSPTGDPLSPLTRASHEADPSDTYRRFLNLLALAHLEDLTPVQRLPWLVWMYDAEVQNGGHAQYFANLGLDHASRTQHALVELTAFTFAARLQQAIDHRVASALPPPHDLNEALQQATLPDYIELDVAYFAEKPPIASYMAAFLDHNLQHFFRLSAGA